MTADQAENRSQRLLLCGLLLVGLIWLLLAALAAHGSTLPRPDLVETARDVHGLQLLAGLVLLAIHGNRPFRWIGVLIGLDLCGMLLFSGSLYLKGWGLAVAAPWLTPLGGLLLMSFWVGALIDRLTPGFDPD